MARYLVIVNLKAGRCALMPDLEARIQAALAPAHVEVLATATPGDAANAARHARRSGRYDAVIAVGGDGTHHGVIDALAGGAVPLGLIPLGTANDLAAEHGIPKDLETACKIIKDGCQTSVDLVRTHGKVFATAGGMGLCADIALGVCEMRRRSRLFHWVMRLVGSAIYQLYMVFTVLFARRLGYTYAITGDDGRRRVVEGYMALVMNQPFLGGNFQAVPHASNRDGAFDVLLIKKVEGRRFERVKLLLTIASTLKGAHLGRPDVEVVSATRLEVRTPDPVAFFADGELVTRADAFSFVTLKRALPLLVPRERAHVVRRLRASQVLASWSGSASFTGAGSASWSGSAPDAADHTGDRAAA